MKKILFTLLCSSIGIHSLFADSESDKKAIAIRKDINELTNKKRKADAIKAEMKELKEDIEGSSVINNDTIKIIDEANNLIENVSDGHLKSAKASLLNAEISQGANRDQEINNANTQKGMAIEKLSQIQLLLTLSADKAKLIENFVIIIRNSKATNQNIVSQIEKELSGEKLNSESSNSLVEKQVVITKEIIKLEAYVNGFSKRNSSITEKDLMGKVYSILSTENITMKSKTVETKIESNELIAADIVQKDCINILIKALKVLAPENEKNNPSDNNEIVKTGLTILLSKMDSAIIKTEKIVEGNIGIADPTTTPEYSNLLNEHRNLVAEIKKNIDDLPLDPKTKKVLETALTGALNAKTNIENGVPEKALSDDKKVSDSIKAAIKSNNENNQPKEGDKPGEKNPSDKDAKASPIANDGKPNDGDKPGNNNPSKDPKKGGKGLNKEDGKENKPNNNPPEMTEVKEFEEGQKATKGQRDTAKIEKRDNVMKLGEMPTAQDVWGNKTGEKDKKVLMQSLLAKAPKEYDDLTTKYFENISSIGE